MKEAWRGFKGTKWTDEINVREFIQNNYTPYEGNEAFLEGPTEATNILWAKLQLLQKAEREKGGVLDMETEILGIVTTVYVADTVQQCMLVMELREKATDSLVLWHGSGYTDGTLLPGVSKMAAALRFDRKKLPPKGKYLKAYLWNPGKGIITQVRTDYYVTRHSARLTGLYDPLSKTIEQINK